MLPVAGMAALEAAEATEVVVSGSGAVASITEVSTASVASVSEGQAVSSIAALPKTKIASVSEGQAVSSIAALPKTKTAGTAAVAATAKMTKNKKQAGEIIEQGIKKIKQLEKIVTDDEGNVFKSVVKLGDVKSEIKKFAKKQIYSDKDIKKLKKMFHMSRLKANTFMSLEVPVERIVSNGMIIDQQFTTTVKLGTASTDPRTRVVALAKEVNKLLKQSADIDSESQEQVLHSVSKIDDLIKDPLDISKGLNLTQVEEGDAQRLVTAIKQISEVADIPNNVGAQRALEEWEEETAELADDMDLGINFTGSEISIRELYDEMDRMFGRLDYDSEPDQSETTKALNRFRNEVWKDGNNKTTKQKYINKVYDLFRTNVRPSPNIRYEEMVRRINNITAELIAVLHGATADKLKELKRG